MPSSPFSRVLVPVDFTSATDELVAAGLSIRVGEVDVEVAPASARALEIAAGLVGAGELRVVHATPALEHSTVYTGSGGLGMLGGAIEEIRRNAEQASLEVLKSLTSKYCGDAKLSYATQSGVPLHVILNEAKAFETDLIVIAASGRSRVARFFVGSTADRIIRQAGCPVLVIPPEHPES